MFILLNNQNVSKSGIDEKLIKWGFLNFFLTKFFLYAQVPFKAAQWEHVLLLGSRE